MAFRLRLWNGVGSAFAFLRLRSAEVFFGFGFTIIGDYDAEGKRIEREGNAKSMWK